MVVNSRWDSLHYCWGHLLSPPDIKHFVNCVVTWSLRTGVWDHSDYSSNSVKIISRCINQYGRGALVDLQDELIGVPTLTIINPTFNSPASGVGFAIPSSRVKLIVPQLINTGSVTHTGRASLGVSVGTVDPTVAAQANLSVDHGALIVSVTPNGPAASAGMQPNDVIVQVDNKQVIDVASLGDALASQSPGDTVTVKVYRGNQQMTFNVKLGELQVAG